MADPANTKLGRMLLDEITPVVMVLRTPLVEESCRKNGFSLIEMLAPFSNFNNIDVPVRTASDQPYRLRKFRLRLFYGSEVRQPNIEVRSIMEVLTSALVSADWHYVGLEMTCYYVEVGKFLQCLLLDQENCFWYSALVKVNCLTAAKERLKQVITFSGDKDISELCSDPQDIESLIATSKQELVPSWFQNFNKELIDVVAFSEHEAFDHPVACLVVVSSKDKDPIDKFVDLFNTNQLPPLLNDGAMDPKILKASGILTEMRSAFGANDCRLLCINSSADGAEEHQENLWASYKTSISNNKQYGCFLNADDIEEEMMGLAYFMLDQARKDAEYCMENAFTTYLKIGPSGGRNATRCGIWWAEMLKARDQFKDAAGVYFRISGEEPLHSAVMLEQASYCFLLSTPTMLRKYGFHLVLSGDLYRKCDQEVIPVPFIRQNTQSGHIEVLFLSSKAQLGGTSEIMSISILEKAIKVDISFRNPLQIPISISNVSLICKHSAEFDETESDANGFLIDHQNDKELRAVSNSGEFSLDTSLFTLSEIDISMRGGETILSLPRLEGIVDNFPKTVYAGDLRRLTLELRNPSKISVKNLKMKISHPRYLIIADQEVMNSEFPTCLRKQESSSESCTQVDAARAASSLFVFPETTAISSETPLKWPLWFRAAAAGSISLYITIYYEMEDESSVITYRTLRMHYNVEVLPSLEVSFRTSPCSSTLQEFLIRMDVINRTSSESFQIHQLSCVGDQWELVLLQPVESVSSWELLIAGQALSCFFKLKNRRTRQNTEENTSSLVTSGRADVKLVDGDSRGLYDTSVSPFTLFHHHERVHQERQEQGHGGTVDFILISESRSGSDAGLSRSTEVFSHHTCHCRQVPFIGVASC
ncbi:UNVERIFIED_CONTAM: Trafficking protein particle complex subunit [Sesamum angustifolium]|uniref:Trafficking protein particle complex subunit n=1 Tax=Sesamum angustifolium TaxID=2727405 RepID=A0AAW2N6X0_9LAMI